MLQGQSYTKWRRSTLGDRRLLARPTRMWITRRRKRTKCNSGATALAVGVLVKEGTCGRITGRRQLKVDGYHSKQKRRRWRDEECPDKGQCE
jgi:hypothetical protein